MFKVGDICIYLNKREVRIIKNHDVYNYYLCSSDEFSSPYWVYGHHLVLAKIQYYKNDFEKLISE